MGSMLAVCEFHSQFPMSSGYSSQLARAVGGAVFAVTLAASAVSGAPTASLAVTAASEASDCPTREALAAEINRVAKREAVTLRDTKAVAARLTLSITRVGGVYHGALRVEGELVGERDFEDDGPNCAGLASAVSVSTALLLDQIESTKSSSRAVPRPETQESVSRSPNLGIEIGAGVTFGLTRPGSPGLSLEGLVGGGRFLAGAGGLWLPARRIAAPPGEVNVGLGAITARGCWIALQPRSIGLSLWLCGRALGGWVHGSAVGFDGSRDVHRPWIGAAAELSLTGRLFGPLRWVLRADGLVPVVNQRFTVAIDGQRRVAFEPADVGCFTAIGLMVSNF
jgi:hypothetical protein